MTAKRDRQELELYRRLAAINGRLEALRAIEAIEKDLAARLPNLPASTSDDADRCIPHHLPS